MDSLFESMLKGFLLALGVAMGVAALSGCVPQGPALAVAPYCAVAKPIKWSADDTRKTKEQADRENAKWKALCANRATAN